MSIAVRNTFLHAYVEEPVLRRTKSTPAAPHLDMNLIVDQSDISTVSASRESMSSWSGSSCKSACTPPPATGRLTKFAKKKDEITADRFTTVMIRNIPCKYTQ